jgi:hypothetical protein
VPHRVSERSGTFYSNRVRFVVESCFVICRETTFHNPMPRCDAPCCLVSALSLAALFLAMRLMALPAWLSPYDVCGSKHCPAALNNAECASCAHNASDCQLAYYNHTGVYCGQTMILDAHQAVLLSAATCCPSYSASNDREFLCGSSFTYPTDWEERNEPSFRPPPVTVVSFACSTQSVQMVQRSNRIYDAVCGSLVALLLVGFLYSQYRPQLRSLVRQCRAYRERRRAEVLAYRPVSVNIDLADQDDLMEPLLVSSLVQPPRL